MSELTDALIQLLGYKIGLMTVILVIADGLQTRYLKEQVESVGDDVDTVRERVERVESVHIAADGGPEEGEP